MDLADLISLNRLVRGTINFSGFDQWFEGLSNEKRRILVHTLSGFAHEAGVDDAVFHSAVTAAALSESDATVIHIRSLRRDDGLTELRIDKWIESVSDEELPQLARFLFALFGTAEGRVFSAESKDWCNHWWHRDILDDRVVQDILNDPKFYMTSMKDDARIKGAR